MSTSMSDEPDDGRAVPVTGTGPDDDRSASGHQGDGTGKIGEAGGAGEATTTGEVTETGEATTTGEVTETGRTGGITVAGENAEIGDLIGRLSAGDDLDRETRGRLLGRLTRLLGSAAGRAGASGIGRGRWLADLFADVAPRIPIRDLETLSAHHGGLRGERLASELVRAATRGTTTVGAAGGALAAVQFAAPPLLLTAPAQLVAETLVVAAIEVKLIAELHEVYGIQVPGSGAARTAVFVTSWAKQRGINPVETGSLTNALGAAAKQALRKRLLRTLGRNLTTLGPFLTGAVAGGVLNRSATMRLADAISRDLRRQVGAGPAQVPRPRPEIGLPAPDAPVE